VGFSVAAIVGTQLPGPIDEALLLLALGGSIGGALVFSLAVMLNLPKPSRPKDRTFASIGVIAPIVWALAITGIIISARL
jgi:hypothetical protein